jgi:hypothetical protein
MVVECSFVSENTELTLKVKAELSYETLSLIYQSKQRHITENRKLHIQHCEKLKPRQL